MDNVLHNIPVIYPTISFSKYLCNTCYEPGTVLTTADKAANVVVFYLISRLKPSFGIILKATLCTQFGGRRLVSQDIPA